MTLLKQTLVITMVSNRCVYTSNIVEFYQKAAQSGIATCMVEYIGDGSRARLCAVGGYFLPNEEK